MTKSQFPRWLSVILLGLGLLILGIPGLFLYSFVTAKTLHPDPNNIQSITNSPPSPPFAGAVEKARQLVRAGLSQRNLPGLSVAVGVDGAIVWAEGFGFADLETNRPVTPDDRFRIGTLSTAFTSAALGLLMEDGQLGLDDEVQSYLPDFPVKQWPLTIRHVMGDVGGVKVEDVDDGVLTSVRCARPSDALARFAEEPLLFQPGTAHAFSTFGWVLLSAVLESASDKPYLTFLQERVFQPVGMSDTIRESGPDPVPDSATSYFTRLADNPKLGLQPLSDFDYSCYGAANGFLSTPSDLVRFGMAVNGGQLLKRETVREFQTSLRLTSGQQTNYGLGWNVKPVTVGGQQVRVAASHGDLWGDSVSSLLTIPDRGITVAVTSNISSADTPSLAEEIARTFATK